MHKFTPSGLDKTLCGSCKRVYKDHSPIAQCEACPKIGPCELFGDMLLCVATCYPQEIAAQEALKATAEQRVIASRNATLQAQAAEKPMTLDALVKHTQKVDQGIEMSSDIWNAKTEALAELIKAVDADSTVDNKPYARAHVTMERIETFQKAIFDAEQQLVDARVGLRQAKTYLNTIIQDLREDERERFRLKDITYPVKPEKTKKAKPQASGKVKVSAKALLEQAKRWADITGIGVNAIHATMVQRNIEAKGAACIMAGLMEIPWKDEWDKLK